MERAIYDLWMDSSKMSPEQVIQTIMDGGGI
jgi:hypothetical protein